MKKRIAASIAVPFLCVAGIAMGQGRVLDKVADKVIAKYQSSTCDQLRADKGQPPSPEEQKAVQFLRSDPAARTAFLNKVAAPIANKMFECGMIP